MLADEINKLKESIVYDFEEYFISPKKIIINGDKRYLPNNVFISMYSPTHHLIRINAGEYYSDSLFNILEKVEKKDAECC